jgi:hypothetical protein
MLDLTSLKIIAKSLADSLDPELGCYIIYNPILPEMRFNFPVVIYFDYECATCVSHINGHVFRAEYADTVVYPDLLIEKLVGWKYDSRQITNKSEEFPADCFKQDCLDYLTKNI